VNHIPGPGSLTSALSKFFNSEMPMNPFRMFLFPILLLVFTGGGIHAQGRIATPLSAAGFSKLTSNKEICGFIRRCDTLSHLVTASFYPLENGLEIPFVSISRP
jgi:hypothetical protein